MIAEAVSGVNVIIWFAITLGTDASTGKPAVRGGLRHAYPDWHPDFKYRGRNVYTAWVSSKFGQVVVESPPPLSAGGGAAATAAVAGSPQGVAAAARRKSVTVPTFDFVDVQLYESWSRASLAIDGPPQTPAPS